MRDSYRVIVVSCAIGVLFWALDAVIGCLFFYKGTPFFDLLIFDIPKHELYSRIIILELFIIFGLLMARVIARRRRVEKALMLSEEKYRAMFESAREGVMVTSPDGRILSANPACAAILGYERARDLIGVSLEKIYVDPAQRKVFVEELVKNGYVKNREVALRKKNGELIYVLGSGTAHTDEEGNILRIEGMFTDITDRKKAEEKYRQVVEHANEAIFVVQDGRLVFVNHKTAELSGYAKDELTSRPFVEFIHPDDREMVIERHRKRLLGEEFEHVYPFRIITKDADVRWVEINAVLIDWEGEPATLNFLSDITERRMAEEALRRSESRYRFLYEAASAVTLTIGLDGLIKDINLSALKSLGYSREDVVGKPVLDFVAPRHREMVEEVLDEIFKFESEDSPELEVGVRAKDDSVHTVLFARGHATIYEKDQPVGALITGLDITERKQAEERMRLLLSAVEQTADGIAVSDLDGNLTYVNKAFAAMHGYEPQELIGEHLSVFHSPDQMPAVEEANKRIRETGEFRGEIWHRRRDGTSFPALMHNSVLHDESGNPIGMIATLRDITDQKRAEEALRTSEEELRAVFETAEDSIFIKDTSLRYVKVNPAMARLFGVEEEELLNKTDAELFGEEVGRHVMETDRRVLSGETVEEFVEKPVEGVMRSFHTIKVPLRDSDGNITGLCGIARDITDRRRAEEALAKAEHEKETILDSLAEHVLFHNTDMEIVWANKAAAESVGVDADQLVGRYCYEIWHQREEPCESCPVVEAIETGKVCENEITTPDGRVWFIRGYPVHGPEGGLVGAVEVTQEVTERKRAEQALRENQRVISTLVSNLPGMVFRCRNDRERTMEFVSDGCYGLTGYVPSDLIENARVSFGQLIHPDDRGRVWDTVQQALGERRPFEATYRIVTASGEEKWVWEQGRGIYSPDVELLYLEGLITDVSERRGVEDALREAEEKYKIAVEQSADNIYIVDVETRRIVEANQALLNLLGYSAEEMQKLTVYNFVTHPPEDINEKIDEVVRKGKAIIGERQYRRKDGSLVDVEVTASLLTSGDKKLLYVVSRDITERKRMEERLRLLATRDELTGFLNRRSGLLVLEKMMGLAKRDGSKLSICFVDVNDLKEVNDTYGHLEGDRLLKTLAGCIKESLRDTDVVCRLGGDEFLLIFPQCPLDQAEIIWKRVASRIAAYNKDPLKPYDIEVSHGFAEYDPDKVKSIYGFIGLADEQMYRDKRR